MEIMAIFTHLLLVVFESSAVRTFAAELPVTGKHHPGKLNGVCFSHR
jgi:hypothetical protein